MGRASSILGNDMRRSLEFNDCPARASPNVGKCPVWFRPTAHPIEMTDVLLESGNREIGE